jgi:hypothetical protein
MSKDLDQQESDFFDRARRNPLRVIDFEYPPFRTSALIVFGHDFDGEGQSCTSCGQVLQDADVHCNKLLRWAEEETTLP